MLEGRNSESLDLWKVQKRIVDALLPPRCVATGEIVDRQGMLAPQIWRSLSFIGAPVCVCCGFPFGIPAEPDSFCASCLASKPPYESARAALVYDDESRGLILKFKHADHTHAVRAFIPWLRRAGTAMLEKADVIVPVPLHRWRLLRRRYNQAALIAQALAKDTGLPWLPDALKRSRATPSQGYLNYKERKKNVSRAFTVHPRSASLLADKTILLVDDVYTTGATVKECAKVLLKAGAGEVHVLAVARVVRPEYHA